MNTIQNFNELMFLKNFSSKTIKSYNSCILNISNKIKKEPQEITELDLREFLLKNKKYSSSTRMGIINAFKCYYRLIFDKDFNHKVLPRPKVEQKQPDILSIEEVQSLINSIQNLKHKSIFSLMYSCAMRVSEVCNLKVKDLDSKNDKIIIKNGKGKIDRIVMLDPNLLILLREYWVSYKTSDYLFEGAKGGRYSEKSIQCLVKSAVNKNGIRKRISSHSLRHSCLTQMIKDGVDLRTVQKIAGHKNINTTASYIKIIDSDILGTISPLSKIRI
jgi:site-specific recombinase XerD